MKNVIIKQTILGRGMPKICAPLVEKDYESLIHQAASFTEQPVDIAEWRADWFDYGCDCNSRCMCWDAG